MTAYTRDEQGIWRPVPALPGLVCGTVARFANRIDYGEEQDTRRSNEKELLARVTGLERRNIVFINQVHGEEIIVLERQPDRDEGVAGDADALVTTVAGICLVVRTADCVPVLLWHPERRVLALVHSGWRGTRLGIAAKTARLLRDRFNAPMAGLQVSIFPSIGPESYVVNEDVARFFPDDRALRSGEQYINLWQHIERALVGLGVPKINIFNPGICNFNHWDDFFSHRRGDAGRNLNFAFFRDESTSMSTNL